MKNEQELENKENSNHIDTSKKNVVNKKSDALTLRTKLILSIPAIVALFSCFKTWLGNEVISFMVMIYIIFLPLEKVVIFFRRWPAFDKARIVARSRLPIKILTSIFGLAIFIYWTVGVGDINVNSLYPKLKWPFYYHHSFGVNAKTEIKFEEYLGIKTVAKLSLETQPDKEGSGGWMIGLCPGNIGRFIRPIMINTSFSDKMKFGFMLRGNDGGEKIELKFKDSDQSESIIIIDSISADKWQYYEIDLRKSFSYLNFTNIDVITFGMNLALTGRKSQTVYLANITHW